jgi:hypothetical protein
MTENTAENLICESCQKQFSCGAKAEKCWCFDIDLENETLAKMRENFKSCLCQDCLEQSAANFPTNKNKDFLNS